MFTPAEIANNFVNVGITKAGLPKLKMLVLGIFAGVFIAFAGAGSVVASATVESMSLAKLVSGIVFPAGLAMVILAGSELFTGNSLIIISVLEKKVKMQNMLINWSIVYAGNLIGSILVAMAFVYSGCPAMFKGMVGISLLNAATSKVEMGFAAAFIKGILCNILVCTAVWMAAAAKEPGGKIAALFFPICVFVICGFEHSIANMFFIPAAIIHDNIVGGLAGLNVLDFIHNLFPVTLGNMAGGLLVGCGYWDAYCKK